MRAGALCRHLEPAFDKLEELLDYDRCFSVLLMHVPHGAIDHVSVDHLCTQLSLPSWCTLRLTWIADRRFCAISLAILTRQTLWQSIILNRQLDESSLVHRHRSSRCPNLLATWLCIASSNHFCTPSGVATSKLHGLWYLLSALATCMGEPPLSGGIKLFNLQYSPVHRQRVLLLPHF